MNQISDKAELGTGVKLGFCVRIYDNVIIGDGSEIGDFCSIGHPTKNPAFKGKPVKISSSSLVRSHTVIYEGSSFEERLETGHHVVLREGTFAGKNLRIGNYSDIEGDCLIGDYCRFHGYVHIGKGSEIGSFVWIYSLVTLTNDPLPPSNIFRPVKIDDGAVLAVGVTVMPGSVIGKCALVAAGEKVSGVVRPARVYASGADEFIVARLVDWETGKRHPWMNHFAEAYPESARGAIEDLKAYVKVLCQLSKNK